MVRYGSAYYVRRRALHERRAREERLRSLAGYALCVLFMAFLVLAAGFCGGIERGTIHVLGL